MAQIFHRNTNWISKASGAAVAVAAIVGAGVFYIIYNSPLVTGQKVKRAQPVPFSHQQHVKGLGMDCRYCHTSVESSSFAGIPPIKTCMTCHTEIKKDSPLLEPVRQAFKTDQPLKWQRVHSLPDYVYFDHSIHVKKGVACVSCHGSVADMDVVWKEKSLHMRWCLDCHRHPERQVRPRESVFLADWDPAKDPAQRTGDDLVKEYKVRSKLDCNACHR